MGAARCEGTRSRVPRAPRRAARPGAGPRRHAPARAAGQYRDAAYGVVQLRKIVDDARAKRAPPPPAAGGFYGYQPAAAAAADEPEVRQLAEACARCEQELEEVGAGPG